jgi:hypothetical protein
LLLLLPVAVLLLRVVLHAVVELPPHPPVQTEPPMHAPWPHRPSSHA